MKILITGATSGIGFNTGINLIKSGHFVYFTVHRKEQIKTVVEKLKRENGSLKKSSRFLNRWYDEVPQTLGVHGLRDFRLSKRNN